MRTKKQIAQARHNAAWRKKNPERWKIIHRAANERWKARNPEKMREYKRKSNAKWQKNHPVEYMVIRTRGNKKWQSKNREYVKQWHEDYFAKYYKDNGKKIRKKRSANYHKNRDAAIKHMGGKCMICNGTDHDKLTFFHKLREREHLSNKFQCLQSTVLEASKEYVMICQKHVRDLYKGLVDMPEDPREK